MTTYLVEFFGSVEVEADTALDAELTAIEDYADEHVEAIMILDEPEGR